MEQTTGLPYFLEVERFTITIVKKIVVVNKTIMDCYRYGILTLNAASTLLLPKLPDKSLETMLLRKRK